MRSLVGVARFCLALPLATLALYACDGDEESSLPAGYEDVIFVGDVTDEALAELVSAPPDMDSPNAPTLTQPTMTELPASPPSAFTWTAGATARLGNPYHFQPPALTLQTFLQPPASSLQPLAYSPFPSAMAHGTPFSGYGTFMVFSTDGNDKLLRVFTSNMTYTPSPENWSKFKDMAAPITVTLVAAQFQENRVTSGPFQGPTFTFTIAP